MDGFLFVDKPGGITSHKVVERVRRVIRMRKVGHLGTLDPLGTGVLVLAIGRATKLVKYFINDDKEYLNTLRLGISTDTQDMDGKIILERETEPITREEFDNIISRFVGSIEQIPPMVSAKKIGGKRLYKLHRKGIVVEREPKLINVMRIEVKEFRPPEVQFEVACSKGTYIRTLCSDIGDTIGCGGCMAGLVRLRSGIFGIDNAKTLDEIEKLTPEEIEKLLIKPSVAMSMRQTRRQSHSGK
ncbi:MAG: tRNA pseudouridine(55) synthase TruB [Thermoplasmata archaeon]|nr:tRNA pseudouridine(55) synthase TruB [Thermoplasmata archaeon]